MTAATGRRQVWRARTFSTRTTRMGRPLCAEPALRESGPEGRMGGAATQLWIARHLSGARAAHAPAQFGHKRFGRLSPEDIARVARACCPRPYCPHGIP